MKLKKYIRDDVPVIIDCSPGASCSVVQAIEGSDYCILVTESTPFGLHDLKIAIKLVKKMEIPFGVFLNKSSKEDMSIQNYCNENGINLLMEIPYSEEIAKKYSKGILPVKYNNELKENFRKLYSKLSGGRYR